MADKKNIIASIQQVLEKHEDISLGILYGSAAKNQLTFESVVDIAVAGSEPLTSAHLYELINDLSSILSRPIDLIDLRVTNGTLLKNILTTGERIYLRDKALYAELLKRMLFNQSDMMPYHYRILKQRRQAWIKE